MVTNTEVFADSPESIRFQVNINGKSDFIDVTINNLGFEDGSGESFLLEGHSEDGRIFKKGYYHTKKKTGYLKLR